MCAHALWKIRRYVTNHYSWFQRFAAFNQEHSGVGSGVQMVKKVTSLAAGSIRALLALLFIVC